MTDMVEDVYKRQVKITPAHDPNDFEVGKRHNLEEITVINDDATMNHFAGKYEGIDRYECRKALVDDLKEQGLLVKVEPHSHNVGTHDRCGTTVSSTHLDVYKRQGRVLSDPEDGSPRYLVGCINEIGAKQKADNVSGLLGEYSLKIFYESRSPKLPQGFLLRISIDDFKNINESHGNEMCIRDSHAVELLLGGRDGEVGEQFVPVFL